MKNTKKKEATALKKLLGYMGKRQILLWLAVILAVLSTALGMAPYLIVGVIAEKVLNPGAGGLFALSYPALGLMALLSILVKGWIFSLSTRLAHTAAFPVLYDIRLMLADKLTRLPLGYFQTNSAQKIKSMMSEQVDSLENGIAHFIPSMAASTAVPLVAMTLLFAMDWRMALAILLYAVILYFSFKLVVKRVMILGKSMFKVRTEIQSVILRFVYGMKIIRAFARSDESYKSFQSSIESTAEEMADIESNALKYKSIVIGISRMSLVFVVPLGILLYSRQTLSLSVFVFFILMATGFGKSFFDLIHGGSHVMGDIKRCMDAVSDFMSQPVLAEPEKPMRPRDNGIAFHDVSFSYDGKNDILKQISFTAKPGSVTAIVGSSGSGKSTIIRLIARFWDASSGSVQIGSVNVRDIGSTELAKQVSAVFQDVFLFNDTIAENIRIGKPDATEEEIITAAKAARCHEFIMALPDGYQTNIGEHGGRLSGGQRQRISIARAILKDAPILLLDEATAFVDTENEGYIQEALSALINPKNGSSKTLIVVAHRLGTIINADQILVISEGAIEAAGTHQSLLQNSHRYKSMWATFERTEQGLVSETIAREHGNVEINVLSQSAEPEHGVKSEAAPKPYETLTGSASYWRKMLSLAGSEKTVLKKACVYPVLTGLLFCASTISIVMVLVSLMGGEFTKAWCYTVTLLAAQLGQTVTERFSLQGFNRYDSAVTRRMRLFLGKHLLRLPMGFFSEYDAATIQARLTVDVAGLSVYDAISTVLRGLVTPLVLFAVLIRLNWILALVSLVGVPAYLWMTAKINRVFEETTRRQNAAKANANSKTLEFIQGIPIIRSFAAPDTRISRYKMAMEEYQDADMDALNRYVPYEAWYSSLFEIGFAAVLLLAGVLLGTNAMEGTTLILFMIVLLGAFEPVPLLSYISARRRYMGAAQRLSEIINYEELSEPSATEEKSPDGFAIQLRNVCFSYGNHQSASDRAEKNVLENISFTIPERSMIALVGPSGGGKSTLLHLMARFWDVESGSITIGNADLREMRADTLMKNISIVFQDVYLFQDTIMNNICFGRPNASMDEVIQAAKAARCHEFIEKLPHGYETMVGEGGSTLSGGEKQRISIARAILKDAPIVLLDEATASIDPENEWEIQEALRALSTNKTLVVVAHRLSTISQADQIIVIDEGRIVQNGSHKQLLGESGLYQRLWNEKNRIQSWKFI